MNFYLNAVYCYIHPKWYIIRISFLQGKNAVSCEVLVLLDQVKKLVILVVIFLTVVFVLFVINQTNQAVSLAAGLHPLLGQIVLYTLLAVYAAAILIPLVAIMKKPAVLFPPEETEGEVYRAYIEKLAVRLKKNRHIETAHINSEDMDSIEEALRALNNKADESIKSAAANVFVMTAISQYGALDAVIVILAQFRMIWQVTLLYNQRPSLRELTYLYGNVFATAFLATRIENLDLLEDQLEPVIASIMGSSLSSLTPAFNTAANVITNSIIQGAANAYLTLRVGVITKNYCASLTRKDRSRLRRIAAAQAAALLAKVLAESTYKVTRAVIRATAKTGKRPFRYGHGIVTKSSRKSWDAGKTTYRKSEELAKRFGSSLKKSGRKLKLHFIKPKN